MGLLRFILAVSVITAHLPGLFFIRGTVGDVSVQAFYMISGFYIAMILNGKYALNMEFWRNRLLRLFPAYLAVLVMAVILKLIISPGLNSWLLPISEMTLKNQIIFVFCNLTLIGQDWILFPNMNSPLLPFMLVPQAWSLGLELTFYAIAPFLLRPFRPKLIAGLVLVTVIARVSATNLGLMNDPWSYRFFPFEFGTFLIGSMAWGLYENFKSQIEKLPDIVPTAIGMVTLAFALSYFALPIESVTKRLLFLLILFISIPFIFALSKDMKIDKEMGDLSYPIYLCHLVVIDLIVYIWDLKTMSQWQMAMAITTSIGFSILIHRFIERPTEIFRQSLSRTRPLSAAPGNPVV